MTIAYMKLYAKTNKNGWCQIANTYFKHVVRKGRNWTLSEDCVAFIFFKSVLQTQKRCERNIFLEDSITYWHSRYNRLCKFYLNASYFTVSIYPDSEIHLPRTASKRLYAQLTNIYIIKMLKMHYSFRQNTIFTSYC